MRTIDGYQNVPLMLDNCILFGGVADILAALSILSQGVPRGICRIANGFSSFSVVELVWVGLFLEVIQLNSLHMSGGAACPQVDILHIFG